MSNQNKTNLTLTNDGFSGLSTANKTNKSVERGFSGVVTSNNNNGKKSESKNTNQVTKK